MGSLVNGNEIHTFWGKTGQINQHSAKHGNLVDLQKIIDEKKNKGYIFVDDFTPAQGWASAVNQKTSQQPQAANPGPTKPPPKLKPVPILKQSHEESSDIKPIEWDF